MGTMHQGAGENVAYFHGIVTVPPDCVGPVHASMLERLKTISLEWKIAVSLGAALILLLGIGFISYRSTTDLIDREARVVQTHEIRETIERLLFLMEDLESKQRIDLLTGESQYPQSYPEIHQIVEALFHTLSIQMSDSQVQQQHLLTLRRLIDLRLAQFKTLIDLRDAGKIDANELKSASVPARRPWTNLKSCSVSYETKSRSCWPAGPSRQTDQPRLRCRSFLMEPS